MTSGDDAGPPATLALAHMASFRLGALFVQPSRRLIVHDDGRESSVEPRVMQVLVALAAANGATLSRDDLIASCWNGRLVSDHAINRVISHLHALSGGIGTASFRIETLSKVGYRLIGTVAPADGPAESVSDERPSRWTGRRTAIVGAIALPALALGGFQFLRRQRDAAARAGSLVVLVSPFEADGKDKRLYWAAQAASISVRADLGRVPNLEVIAATSSAAIARERLSAQEIGKRARADLVIEGNMLADSGGLRLQLAISDTATGRQIWSTVIAAPAVALEQLQQDAAAAIIEQIASSLAPLAPPSTYRSRPRDPEAYRLTTQAQALCDEARSLRMGDDVEAAFDRADQADRLVRQAMEIDPQDPGALLVLAQLTRNGWTRRLAATNLTADQRARQATDHIRRALHADPANPDTLAMLGDYYRRFEWRWNDAEALFQRAIAINPSHAEAHWSYAHQLGTLGRALEGLDHALKLFQLDPEHLWRRITFPRLLYLCGQRQAAIRRYRLELAAAPGNLFLLYEMHLLHLSERDIAGLRTLAASVAALWNGATMPAGVRALATRIDAAVAAIQGHPAPLEALLDADFAELTSGKRGAATMRARARNDLPFILAMEYSVTDNIGRSIDLLDSALAAQSLYWPACLPFGHIQFPARMRADARFAALWRRDSRLADAISRRQRALLDGQSAGIGPDGRISKPIIPKRLQKRIDAALERPIPRDRSAGG